MLETAASRREGTEKGRVGLEIRFYATLRAIAGGKFVELETPESPSVQQVLDLVIARFPALSTERLDLETGALSRRAHIMINGRSAIYLEEGLATLLEGHEAIDFFPAVAGG